MAGMRGTSCSSCGSCQYKHSCPSRTRMKPPKIIVDFTEAHLIFSLIVGENTFELLKVEEKAEDDLVDDLFWKAYMLAKSIGIKVTQTEKADEFIAERKIDLQLDIGRVSKPRLVPDIKGGEFIAYIDLEEFSLVLMKASLYGKDSEVYGFADTVTLVGETIGVYPTPTDRLLVSTQVALSSSRDALSFLRHMK